MSTRAQGLRCAERGWLQPDRAGPRYGGDVLRLRYVWVSLSCRLRAIFG